MDIDVKNALNRLLKRLDETAVKTIISDVRNFIEYISVENAAERFEYFCKVYVPDINTKSIASKGADISIETAKYLSLYDKDAFIAFIDFMTILGKSYLFSRFDKKSIDREKFVEYIQVLRSVNIQETDECKNDEVAVANTPVVNQHNKECGKDQDMSIQSPDKEVEESLDELMLELESLIGLAAVKKEVEQLVSIISMQNKAAEFGVKQVPLSYHLVFYGNPGTGKTTVARLLAKIYKALGVIATGQLVEVDRGGLVGSHVGETSEKTGKIISESLGGILFIDEAYTLTHGKGENDFGQEAVDAILKAMEDKRDEFVVIVAGYPDLMKEFISSNPGLKSRFNRYIYFEDYTPDELQKIFLYQCDKSELVLEEGGNEFLSNYFSDVYINRGADYANGRDVRNYFENVYKMHANRLRPMLEALTLEDYRTLTIEDLSKATECKNEEW